MPAASPEASCPACAELERLSRSKPPIDPGAILTLELAEQCTCGALRDDAVFKADLRAEIARLPA